MQHESGAQAASGGGRLYTQWWIPAGEVRELAVIAHGLAEHSGRYGELVEQLLARQFAVAALDHRGHGRSDGPRAYLGSFSAVVDDLATWIARARSRFDARPLTLIGHSLGGALALWAALEYPARVDRLVLSAPALGADPALPRAQLLTGRLLSLLAPRAGILRLPAAAISRDPAVVARYERDPLVYRGSIPARTLVELLGAMRTLAARAPALTVPTLVLHGTADALVPLEFTQPVYARLGSPDLTIKLYEGLYHEVFNEPERARVFADLTAWLDARR